ncbi:MAG: diacylglycerol kinase family lipid kinase [Bacilli bacterium]|jgi:YegS/Rv2252/BmrU family lipid kinase|nr:diacylglycerol kinase family lipid kinase [Bacilli bacterium]MDY0063809.1 diacylglycerol kinase family lipid kinase [Bacilli bacterium]
MKCIFLYNPNSGKGKIVNRINYIKKELSKKFDFVEIHPTKSTEDTIETAKESCDEFDVIIFAGGDGTFNDIACGVASRDKRPILGYIPAGTMNDIAHNLGISTNVRKALKHITDGRTIYHDVGLINGKYFIYVSAMGTFTGVSYRTKQKTKKIFGKLAYAFDGLKDIVNPLLSHVTVKTESEEVHMEVPLVLVVNSIQVGGVPFNRYGHLNDGLFDIILVKRGIGNGLINILKLFTFGIGIKRITKHFVCLKGSKFDISTDEGVIWCIDGEAGPIGSVHIENIPKHLQIYVPKKKNFHIPTFKKT